MGYGVCRDGGIAFVGYRVCRDGGMGYVGMVRYAL